MTTQKAQVTTEQEIIYIVAKQHDFFKTGATKSYQSRIENLNKLKAVLIKYETEMHDALKQDLGKPEFESYLSETGFSLHDLSSTIKRLKGWMKPKYTMTSLLTDVTHAPDRMRVVASQKNYKLLIHSNRCVTSVIN